MPPEEESSLDKLQKRLYANKDVGLVQPEFLEKDTTHKVSHAWEHQEPIAPLPTMAQPRKKTSFAVLFFTLSAVFFVVAGGIAAYLLLSGDRSVSTDNVTIGVQGPTNLAAGDTIPLSITIENRNPTPLENADIVVTFPQGTRSATDVTQLYPRYEENLGEIVSGAHLDRSVKAVIFAEQGQTITIPVDITYTTTGSNAVFKKSSTFTFTVSSSPISLTVTTLTQAVSGQPLTLDVVVRSNATTPIPGVMIQPSYPFGFSVTDQTLQPTDSGQFSIGTLNPGESKDIKITGTLTGTLSSADVFTFAAGTVGATGNLGITYTTKQASVGVAAPFLDIGLSINGTGATNAVITPGAVVNANVSWQNTLQTDVNNASIVVAFQGAPIDPASVQVSNGFYQSSDNTIHFDRDTEPTLQTLAPGAKGVGSFSFSTVTGTGNKNGAVNLVISIQGQRLNESQVSENVTGTVTDTLRLANNLSLTDAALHTSGPFPNTGPIPPTANQATTYTVVWKIDNIINAVGGATVTATLPIYATWTGQTSSNIGTISYTSATRTVTWDLGDLGANSPATTGYFQVSLTPSVSQKGTSPNIVSAPTFSGYDRFAQTQLTVSANPVNTDTSGDPGYSPGSADVQ